jgi:endonuclease/exonuclease/phosphatase family metal-dependent hydrolase
MLLDRLIHQKSNLRGYILSWDRSLLFALEREPFSRSLHPLREALHGAEKTPATYPAFFPILPLDRIFVSPREARIELTTETTHVTRVCSDHLPLGAAITLP